MRYILPFLALATPALAEGQRDLDAHEHGVGELNMAIEGSTLAMEFHAPGADIVGFEYTPESDADRAAVETALATLAKPLSLFAPSEAAGCSVTSVSVALEAEDDHDHDHDAHAEDDHDHDAHAEDDHDHDAHAEQKHDDHDHDDHAEHKHDDHDHEEHAADAHDDHDHDHDDHAEAEVMHTEFHAEYTLTCASPERLADLTFLYFEAFENARAVEVQIVTEGGAQAFEVERDAPVLSLKDML